LFKASLIAVGNTAIGLLYRLFKRNLRTSAHWCSFQTGRFGSQQGLAGFVKESKSRDKGTITTLAIGLGNFFFVCFVWSAKAKPAALFGQAF
jgi:hypothetical protein